MPDTKEKPKRPGAKNTSESKLETTSALRPLDARLSSLFRNSPLYRNGDGSATTSVARRHRPTCVACQKLYDGTRHDLNQRRSPATRDVENRTPKRIGIQRKPGHDAACLIPDQLIIPAFGMRSIEKELLENYDYALWQEAGFLLVEPCISLWDQLFKMSSIWIMIMNLVFGALLMLAFGTLIGIVDVVLTFFPGGKISIDGISFSLVPVDFIGGLLRTWGYDLNTDAFPRPLFILVTILTIAILGCFGITRIFQRYLRVPNKAAQFFIGVAYILVTLVICFAIPIALCYVVFYRDSPVNQYADILTSGLIVTFVAIASLMPGLCYFLFTRLQLRRLQKSFYREVVLLDKSLYTTAEATTKYGLSVEEVYGAAAVGSPKLGTPIPVLIATLLITVNWMLVFVPLKQFTNGTIKVLNYTDFISNMLQPGLSPLQYGFMGAYVFSIYMTFRRYVRSDLTPKAYNAITVRILVTLTIVWTVSTIPVFGQTIVIDTGQNTLPQTQPPGFLYALAFLIGFVPDTGLAFLQDLVRKSVGGFVPTLKEEHPLSALDGVTLYDSTRLLEEGIENIESFIHSSIIELRLRTRIPMARIVDLFDQGILYLHLGYTKEASDAARHRLAVYGIRTATDLLRAYESSAASSEARTQLLTLLQGVAIPPSNQPSPDDGSFRVGVIAVALGDDEWLQQICAWREPRDRDVVIYRSTSDLLKKLEEEAGEARVVKQKLDAVPHRKPLVPAPAQPAPDVLGLPPHSTNGHSDSGASSSGSADAGASSSTPNNIPADLAMGQAPDSNQTPTAVGATPQSAEQQP